MKSRLVSLLAGALALVLGFTFYLNQNNQNTAWQQQLQTATLLPSGLKQLPDVTMADQRGKTFSGEQWLGEWKLLFFGYTHCPDVCPMTLSLVNKVVTGLQDPAADTLPANAVFVSVDPTRDTPQHMLTYLDYFNPQFVGLSPAQHELTAFTQNLGIVFNRVENPDRPEDYLMDHTASVFLINPAGDVQAMFSPPLDPVDMLADIRLIAQHY